MKKLIIFIIPFYFVSCIDTKKADNNSTNNLQFKIDYKLLKDKPFLDSNFSIYIPNHWSLLDSNKLLQIKSIIEISNKSYKQNILSVFQSPNLSTCLISKVISKEKSFGFLPINYKDSLMYAFDSDTVNINDFMINNSKIRQFITNSNTHTNIKIFVEGIDKYEINYIIELSKYVDELGNVQSSIGTITNK